MKSSQKIPLQPVIFSQGLEAGPLHCPLLVGPRRSLCGPDRAPVSLSVKPPGTEEPGALSTPGISGQYGFASSMSAILQSSLVSRLQAQSASNGSTLYFLTWRERVTPAGRRICALRASVPRTYASDYSGWPTACAQDGKNGGPSQTDRLPGKSLLVTGWPTACARDWKSDLPGCTSLPGTAALAGWGTPTAMELGNTLESYRAMKAITALNIQVQLTSKGLQNGSPVAMGRPARLNPDFTRWLMGYPVQWAECAPKS